MKTDSNSYKSILKGISIFGGVKMFEIVVNLIRSKFVAIFLGPQGMGLSSLFSNVSLTIGQLSSFGLNLAVVKEIASAKEDPERLSQIISLVKRLFKITALVGALFCILLAPVLSDFSFGSDRFTSQFLYIAVAVFFIVDNGGKLSVLQGMHEVKRLSGASLIGALTGLLIGVPLYWKFGNEAIAPAIALLAFTQNIFYTLQLRKVSPRLQTTDFRLSRHSSLIKRLFSLGIILLASDLIGNGCNYLLLVAIRIIGDIDDVGFFQSANSVTNQLAGVVFTAMSLDYFPRLSAAASENKRMNEIVDRQSDIVGWVILPLALSLILFAPLVVELLLTPRFAVIIPMLRWMGLGVVLKAISFPMAYISFAKDNKRLFFWLEGIVGNLLFLISPLIFFHFFGLTGFGYGMVAEQTLCFIIYYLVNRRFYGYRPSHATIVTFIIAVSLTGATLYLSYIPESAISYSLMGILTACATIGCVRHLKKNIHR